MPRPLMADATCTPPAGASDGCGPTKQVTVGGHVIRGVWGIAGESKSCTPCSAKWPVCGGESCQQLCGLISNFCMEVHSGSFRWSAGCYVLASTESPPCMDNCRTRTLVKDQPLSLDHIISFQVTASAIGEVGVGCMPADEPNYATCMNSLCRDISADLFHFTGQSCRGLVYISGTTTAYRQK